MAASVYLQKVETMMDAWMTYSKANSRCTLAVRCSVCATVNCRNALSMACRAVHQPVCEHRDQNEKACVRRRLRCHAWQELGNRLPMTHFVLVAVQLKVRQDTQLAEQRPLLR